MEEEEFRTCGAADAPVLCELGAQTYREAFAPCNTQENIRDYLASAFAPARMEGELQNPDSVFVLALKDGRPAGYLKLNRAPAQTELNDPATLELERIYVLQQFQGKGFGQRLLDRAVQQAKAENLSAIWLGVWEKNEKALAFYEKNGFVRFGQHIFKLGDDDQLDYLMRKEL